MNALMIRIFRHTTWHNPVKVSILWTISVLVSVLTACQDLTPPLPAGIQSPESFRTEAGAAGMYRGALRVANTGFVKFVLASGLFTDELQSTEVGNPRFVGSVPRTLDGRHIIDDSGHVGTYAALHAIRSNTMQAIGALTVYAPNLPSVMRAEMYALQGYAEVLLAELYCSGIPLSRVDFEGDYTLAPRSTTAEVYAHAITLFDSAIALSQDSVRVSALASIGKARALLNQGQFEQVAAIVSSVPDNYAYTIPLDPGQGTKTFLATNMVDLRVSNLEGVNGLPFRSSKDPRSGVRSSGKMPYIIDSIWWPLKYDGSPLALVVASALEVKLMQAEVDLRRDGTQWLAILNALRTDGTYRTSAPNGDGSIDTTWNAGEGGVDGLRPLNDPATEPRPPHKEAKDVRVDLLFAERGYWLFLTGHRQGDFRRLIRIYEREPNTVFPTGGYDPNGFSQFGNDVTVPVPESERLLNSLYKGCVDRNA